jgi:hypothetical protein
MLTQIEMKEKLAGVFDEAQATVLAEVVNDAYNELVKARDFNELKTIVKDLADAQKEHSQRITRLEDIVADLADAQKRTELKLADLADAQKRTELKLADLADAQKRTEQELRVLTKGLNETRGELGGLSRSFGYAFENEAYRMLPRVLRENYGIDMQERLLRTEIGGKEINVFGQVTKDGKGGILVGEVKLRLDERRKRGEKDVFDELEEKVEAVKGEYETEEIIRVLVTHFATKGAVRKARDRGVIVVQSFEW